MWRGSSTSTTSGDWSCFDSRTNRARSIEWILLDVDGVLLDGRLIYGADGEQWKVFDVRDGLGMKLAQRAGLKVGILSGRVSAALERPAQGWSWTP